MVQLGMGMAVWELRGTTGFLWKSSLCQRERDWLFHSPLLSQFPSPPHPSGICSDLFLAWKAEQ